MSVLVLGLCMRKFLYITPYFPPQSQVGALRPLKFARHLPDFGWSPVVLCDLWKGASTASGLLPETPASVVPVFDYSARAREAMDLWRDGKWPPKNSSAKQAPQSAPWWERWIPEALNNPELIPLGEHSLYMPHAIGAAQRVLKQHPSCEAVVVNSDPYAAMLVGAVVARRAGLPLVLDLRDPWSVCELRRVRRPALIRKFVDGMERWVVTQASQVILNTETTWRDYVRHYSDLGPGRFSYIRNHGDRALIAQGNHPGFDRFTVLFLGRFRRFVEGIVLIEALAELRRRGVAQSEIQLVVTGSCPDSTWRRAEALGVESMLKLAPFVPYREIGSVMDAADLLLILSNNTTQRMPAKFYDYALGKRPILAVAHNPELGELLKRCGGGDLVGLEDVQGIADVLEAQLALGRQRDVKRIDIGLSSRDASQKLASILEKVTAR